jgi:hypothetical protein
MAINAKLQTLINIKNDIGTAITNKGGTITTNTPFFNYAAQIDGISTGGGAYSTFVAQAQDNSLYTVYNGYDALTNPTPNLSNNFAFNRWILNNSATGDVVLSNVVVAVGGNFNGPNTVDISLQFINNTASYGGTIRSITTNNGFIYAGGFTNNTVQKFHESNLAFVNNTVADGGPIYSITTNGGFIYVGGAMDNYLQKYHESNLAFIRNSSEYAATIYSVATNNSHIYAGGVALGGVNRGIGKYRESDFFRIGNTVNYGGATGSTIFSITINNGFIYAGGATNQTVYKFNESTLAFVGSTAAYGGTIFSITTNNGFIYVGGATNLTVQKFYESNLAFVGNTASYGGTIETVTTNNGFIYVGGRSNQTVQKFYESNLAFVKNTAAYGGTINTLKTNNGFIYAGGATNQTVQKFEEAGLTLDNQTFYNITNIKE